MPRVFFIGFAVIALIASLAAWHWRTERIAVVARKEEARARSPAVDQPQPAASLVTVAVPVAVPPEPAKPAEPSRAAWFEAMLPDAAEARRARDPRLLALQVRKLRLELLLKNGAFLRSHSLPDEEREQLLSAWVERELALVDLRVLSREFGVRSFGPEIRAEQQAVDKKMREVEAAVLGGDGSAALAEYRRTQQVRDFVGGVVGEAALAGFPLTVEQADAVTAILVHSRPGRPVSSISQVDLSVAEGHLQAVLTSEQIDLLLLPLRERAAGAKLSQLVYAEKSAKVAPEDASRRTTADR